MKIRNGFVSNSSSSSFLIKLGEKYPDILSVATNMIKDRFDAWRSDDDYSVSDQHPKEAAVYNNIERLRRSGNVNFPIFFRSTNYDTYIVPVTENYVYVDTCNNIQWKIQYENGATVPTLPDEVVAKYPEAEGYYGEVELRIKRGEEFYLLENGIIATLPSEYTTCKKCYQEVWDIDGVQYCVNCDWDTLSRGLKVEKLKSLINIENPK